MWEVLALTSSLIAGTRMVVVRMLGKKKPDASLYSLLVSFICVWTTGIVVVLIRGQALDYHRAYHMGGFILLGGLLFGLSNLFYFQLFRHVHASVGALLTMLQPLAQVLVATILGAELLNTKQLAGISLMLASFAVAGILMKKKDKKDKKYTVNKSLWVSFLMAFSFAFGVMNEKHLLQSMPLSTYLFFGWGGQLIAVIIIYVFLSKKYPAKGLSKQSKQLSWVSGLLLCTSGLLFVLSLNLSKNASITVALNSVKVLVAMVLAFVFLGERKGYRLKALSLLIGSVGMVLLL